ncbi:MAG: hypothetical protein ACYC2Y_01155 [Armatimonadota bacterium]
MAPAERAHQARAAWADPVLPVLRAQAFQALQVLPEGDLPVSSG